MLGYLFRSVFYFGGRIYIALASPEIICKNTSDPTFFFFFEPQPVIFYTLKNSLWPCLVVHAYNLSPGEAKAKRTVSSSKPCSDTQQNPVSKQKQKTYQDPQDGSAGEILWTKPDNLSLSPRFFKVGRSNSCKLFSDPHMTPLQTEKPNQTRARKMTQREGVFAV